MFVGRRKLAAQLISLSLISFVNRAQCRLHQIGGLVITGAYQSISAAVIRAPFPVKGCDGGWRRQACQSSASELAHMLCLLICTGKSTLTGLATWLKHAISQSVLLEKAKFIFVFIPNASELSEIGSL